MNAAAIAGGLLFGITTAGLLTGTMFSRIDDSSILFFRNLRESVPPIFLSIAQRSDDLTFFGGSAGFLALVGWLTFRQRYRLAGYLAVGIFGEATLFVAFAFLFGRSRPGTPGLLESIPIPGYPSGHVMFVVVFAGVLLYSFLPTISSLSGRTAAVLGALLAVLAIAFLRLFLLAHYLTDIIAAVGLGLTWCVLTIRIVDALFRRYGGEGSS